jgi:hypothetical protein
MITVDRPTVYDEALSGEPLARPVPRRVLNTDHLLWTVGDWHLLLIGPPPTARRVPDAGRMISELRAWTAWSSRKLASVLGTSHTTVLGIEAGRPLVEGHSGDLGRRVSDVHDVVSRVFLLADRDQSTTARLLDTPPHGGRSPIDALRSDDAAGAYLAAVDVLRPRSSGLLVGSRPRREGAITPLHD